MEQSSFQDEQTVRHQFDSLCKLALKSEVINYEKHMAYRQKYEVMLSELSEKELNRLFIMDEHEMETHRFQVLGYDIEVKDALIAEALQTLTEKKRNVVLLSYFMDMSDADIAREMNLVQVIRCERLFSDSLSLGAIHFSARERDISISVIPSSSLKRQNRDKHFGSSAYLKPALLLY